jgi:hypothetical protein
VEGQCLLQITDWKLAVARIQHRLVPAARRAGARAATVSCDSPHAWTESKASLPGYERAGFVRGDSVIHLSPRTCSALARLVSHPTRLACVAARRPVALCPPSLETEALAVVTLAHEQQHVDGVANEAKAECYALQRASLTARQLGLRPRVAARIASFTSRNITQPPAYRSADCRRGGRLDLKLAAGWPAGL